MDRRLFFALVAVAAVVVGWLGYGVATHHSSQPPIPLTTLSSGVVVTTPAGLIARSYAVGDCVAWDQPPTDDQATRVVPCSEPHLIEVVGVIDGDSQDHHFPADAEWGPLIQERCTPLAIGYLGSLDPQGRLGVGALRPAQDAWSVGDRKITCYVDVRADGERMPEVTGTLVGQDQSLLSS